MTLRLVAGCLWLTASCTWRLGFTEARSGDEVPSGGDAAVLTGDLLTGDLLTGDLLTGDVDTATVPVVNGELVSNDFTAWQHADTVNSPGGLTIARVTETERGIDPSEPLAADLVGYWKFDGSGAVPTAAGAVIDSSGNGHHGTLQGSANFDATAPLGAGLALSGHGSFVAVADAASLDIDGALTIAGWIKPNRSCTCVLAGTWDSLNDARECNFVASRK